MHNFNLEKTENNQYNHDKQLSSKSEFDTRTEKILELSDRMLEKISRAIDEIDMCVTKDKKRTKKVEYDSELKKPIKETYTEKETVRSEKTTVDTASLKQLVSTLKDIKDIQSGIYSSTDGSDENENGVILISEILNMEDENENHMDTAKKAGNFSVSSRI
ncbi:MAG: hypothetical protein IJB70_09360 [Clostridia bacterium]|nr:hypothetical protein [Clostridia bacterium]